MSSTQVDGSWTRGSNVTRRYLQQRLNLSGLQLKSQTTHQKDYNQQVGDARHVFIGKSVNVRSFKLKSR